VEAVDRAVGRDTEKDGDVRWARRGEEEDRTAVDIAAVEARMGIDGEAGFAVGHTGQRQGVAVPDVSRSLHTEEAAAAAVVAAAAVEVVDVAVVVRQRRRTGRLDDRHRELGVVLLDDDDRRCHSRRAEDRPPPWKTGLDCPSSSFRRDCSARRGRSRRERGRSREQTDRDGCAADTECPPRAEEKGHVPVHPEVQIPPSQDIVVDVVVVVCRGEGLLRVVARKL
jgi:hypothetical protein